MRGLAVRFRNPAIRAIWPPEAIETEQARPFGIPSGRRALDFLVEPIADSLRPLYWLAWQYDSSPFVELLCLEGGEELLAEAEICPIVEADSPPPCILYRPGWLPNQLRYLYDDWQDLIGFHASDDKQASALAASIHGHHGGTVGAHDAYVESASELRFYCIDGAEWHLFARDGALIHVVESRIRDIRGLDIRPTTLGERYW